MLAAHFVGGFTFTGQVKADSRRLYPEKNLVLGLGIGLGIIPKPNGYYTQLGWVLYPSRRLYPKIFIPKPKPKNFLG